MEKQKYFPWDDVNVERNNKWLQKQHSLENAKRAYLQAAPCPRCKASADQLAWFYYRVPLRLSPPFHGRRAGWLTVCDQCNLQVDFFLEQQELFGWERVNASKDDESLQSQHSLEDALREYLHNAVPCPRCKAAASQLSWLYFREFGRAGWLTVCDQCNLQVDFFIEQQEHISWEQVNASRNDQSLQSQHSLEEAKSRYLERAMPCPRCKSSAEQLSWIYYMSPEQSWRSLAGRAGWLTICETCNIQVDFFVEMMS